MEREQQGDSSLHTIAIILLCCGAVKMLHLLGVITVEGESVLRPLSPSTNLVHRVGRRLWKLSGFLLSACSIYRSERRDPELGRPGRCSCLERARSVTVLQRFLNGQE